MENLPTEIEKKLEELPILPFEINEEFQNLISSDLFTEIFEYYKNNYLPDNLKAQPELYQRVSLYLVLTGQDTSLVEQVDQLLYRRPVPTIEEFLDHPRYMGLQNSSMYPYWKTKLCEIFSPSSGINRVLWSGATGTGKMEDKNTVIPTPQGYKKIGDMSVGEYLWGKNGKPTKIINIFEKGIREMFKVTFDDNTFIRCGGDHLWEIINYQKNKKIIRDTNWLFNHSLRTNGKINGSGKLYKYGIEYCQPVEYPEKQYTIHPYILGVLLGDANLTKSVVDIANKPDDYFIINKVDSLLDKSTYFLKKRTIKHPKSYIVNHYYINLKNKKDGCIQKYENGERVYLKKGFINLTKALGINTICNNKHIPEEYLLGSIEQRLELLRGLMDTDGSIAIRKSTNTPCKIEFGTTSKQLANNIAELVRSLGGKAKIAEYDRRETKKSCNFVEFIVRIWINLNPFYLPRKANLFKPRLIKRKIVSVEKDGNAEARCFEVDSDDHLYLTRHYIPTHNTVTARKAVIYSLYKLLCLRYPRSVLGVEEGSTLAVFVLSVTQKNAYQTNLEPLIRILSNMPCFQRVRNMGAFDNFDLEDPRCPFPFFVDKANLTVVFKDNIIITLGSSIANTVGYDIVISACDEINEAGVEKGMELLNSIDGRLDSRFKGSKFVFQNVMSSARSTESVTREYSKKWEKDVGFLYLHPMRFEVKEGAEFKGNETFPILIGNGIIPSKIITDLKDLKDIFENKYIPPVGCEIVNVPTIYRNQFEAQLEQQIQDILGIDTQDTKNVFRDTTHLEDTLLTPEMYLDVAIKDNVDILELISEYNLFEQDLSNHWQFKRAPKADRYCHIDLAGGGDNGQCDAAVCILHKEYKINETTREKDIVYVIDLMLLINAKTRVDIHAIQNFLTNLVIEKNIPIHTVSADQYQSLMFLQQLEASGCFNKVDKLSVDIKLEPYINCATLLEKGYVKMGKCPKTKKELEALILEKGKVTRTTELKDAADALVGAIWNAQLNYTDIPIYQYINTKNKEKEISYLDFIDINTQKLISLKL